MNLKSIVDYYQPDFYHFSEDSVHLAKYAADVINKRDDAELRGLDICSGCGVVAFEILARSSKFRTFNFCEKQVEFKKFFDKNCQEFLSDHAMETNSYWDSFQKLKTVEHQNIYDLVVCNPPYFCEDSNRLGESSQKNICRFWKASEIKNLVEVIGHCLKAEGVGYFLYREPLDQQYLSTYLPKEMQLKKVRELDGANLFFIGVLNKN